MPYGTTGLYPFPVEIWRYIFSLVEDSILYSAKEDQSYQHFFSDEEESQLWDMDAFSDRTAVQTRLSIVLTCRSWYYMGISTLWSHLLLNGRNINSTSAKIYDAIRRDATLGPQVLRLSIVQSEPYDPTQMARTILPIIPFLTNVSTLYCSVQLLTRLPSSFRAKSAFIRALSTSGKIINSHVSRISLPDACWRHFHTLSLVSPLGPVVYAIKETHVVFPNLVNLRLCIGDYWIFQWIVSEWHLPVLKNFSLIMAGIPDDRRTLECINIAPLLQRIRLKLEQIQLPVTFSHSTDPGNPIEFPHLQELHLVDLHFCSPGHSFHTLTAPNLHKAVFYVNSHRPQTFSNYRDIIMREVTTLSHLHLPMRKIDIIVTSGAWLAAFNSIHDLVIAIEDVNSWVLQELCVRVILGAKREEETFTPESIGKRLSETARLVMGNFAKR